MANAKIRGITIKIDGDTSGLEKSLKDTNAELNSTQRQLKDVEKLLKLDPTNTELLAQKQQLLAQASELSTQKIKSLSDIESKLKDAGVAENSEQMNALKREAIATEQNMDKLNKTTEKTHDGLSKLGTVGKTALKATGVAAAAAATAVAKMVVDATKAYAEYEQLIGGVETLFDEQASAKVAENAANAFKTAGLSANEYMETVTSFSASLIQSVGGNTKRAAALADKAIIDMSDNANKMGTDISSIQNAYQGFAKGNYTMLDNLKLGYGGTKTEMERLLAKAKELSAQQGKIRDFSIESYADIVEAIHLVQDDLGITGATAAEASTTIQGSLNATKAAFQNLLVAFGDGNADLGASVDALVDSAMTLGENLIPVLQQILKSLAETLQTIVPVIVEMLPGLINDLLPPLLDATAELFEGLAKALPELLRTVVKILPGLMDTICDTLIELLPEIIEVGIQLMIELAKGILLALPDLLLKVPQIITAIVKGLKNGFSQILSVGTDLVKGLWEGIKGAAGWLMDKVKGFAVSIIDGIKDTLGIASPSKLTMQIGEFLADGLGIGFDKEMKTVNRNMLNALDVPNFTATAAMMQPESTATSGVNLSRVIALLDTIANKDTNTYLDGKLISESVNNHLGVAYGL